MLVCIYMFKFRKFLYTLWSTNIDCHSIKLYKNKYINTWVLLFCLLLMNIALNLYVNYKTIFC